MLAELRAKSQITLPKELVDRLGLSEGDKLQVFEKDGTICMMPVAVYPKKYLEQLKEEIETTKAQAALGKLPAFDSVDSLLEMLEQGEASIRAGKVMDGFESLKEIRQKHGI